MSKKICDNCIYYLSHRHSLLGGYCMLFELTTETPIGKEVSYTDNCDDWVENNNPKEKKMIIDTFMEQINQYKERKRRSMENKKHE